MTTDIISSTRAAIRSSLAKGAPMSAARAALYCAFIEVNIDHQPQHNSKITRGLLIQMEWIDRILDSSDPKPITGSNTRVVLFSRDTGGRYTGARLPARVFPHLRQKPRWGQFDTSGCEFRLRLHSERKGSLFVPVYVACVCASVCACVCVCACASATTRDPKHTHGPHLLVG
jgi:hypothetical protein